MTATGGGAQKPENVEALIARGERAHSAGRLAEAVAIYRQVLAIRPDVAEVHNDLGMLLASLGDLEAAATHLRRAIALSPDFPGGYTNLGIVLGKQNRLDEAVAQLEHALELNPNLPNALNNLGIVLESQGKLDEAVVRLEQALALRPDFAVAHKTLGDVFIKQGRFDEALAVLSRATTLDPRYADAHNSLGNALACLGKFDQAAARYQQALACQPNYARAELNLAACYLIQGDFERGWPAYEARLRLPETSPPLPLPRWRGEPLAGRRLLLRPGGGNGDLFQFIRFARCLKERGAWVALMVARRLGPLLKSYRDLDALHLLGSDGPLPEVDFWLPLLSAPGELRTDAATIPADVPYLFADPELVEKWRQELAAIPGLKVGIVWQGSTEYYFDRWRSVPLSEFAPLARIPGVTLISLQKGYGTEQIPTVDFPVVDLSQRLDVATGSFMDTAAVIRNLDLVITPDTAIAHLAGALGAPVWLALQFSPDWRWRDSGDETPWYPSMRLFRQSAPLRWTDVFERMAAALAMQHDYNCGSPATS